MWLSLLIAPSLAQDVVTGGEVPEGLNSQLFRPSIDGERMLWVNDSLLAPDRHTSGRFLLSYVNDPLSYTSGTGERTELVSDLLQLDLLGAYTRGPVRFGLDVPLLLRSAGEATGGETGLGDITAGARWTAIQRQSAPVGAALAVNATVPTSTVDAPLGYGGLGWEVEGILDKEIGNALLAFNIGHRGLPEVQMENLEWDDQFFSRLGLGYALSDDGGLSGELASNLTYSSVGAGGAPLELLGGGYRRMGDNLMFRGGLGAGLNAAVGAPKFRVLLAVAYEPPHDAIDTDNDGLLDSEDVCPTSPEDIDTIEDADGCPEPTLVSVSIVDASGQPVAGAEWSLGEETGSSSGEIEMFGGTYPLAVSAVGYVPTSSQEAIPDALRHSIVVTLEEIAAPGQLLVTVTDMEGVAVEGAVWSLRSTDLRGQQPGEPVDVEGGEYTLVVSAQGYRPEQATVEIIPEVTTEHAVVLKPARAEVQGERIDIKDSVYFETARSTIKPESFSLLDDVAAILSAHSELQRIRIEGHTDSRGAADYNKGLSQQRADAVREYLINKGIESSRLESIGYGEERPLVSGENAAAWEKNRRVDFFVVERSDE